MCKIKHLRPRHSRRKSTALKHFCECFILHVTMVLCLSYHSSSSSSSQVIIQLIACSVCSICGRLVDIKEAKSYSDDSGEWHDQRTGLRVLAAPVTYLIDVRQWNVVMSARWWKYGVLTHLADYCSYPTDGYRYRSYIMRPIEEFVHLAGLAAHRPKI